MNYQKQYTQKNKILSLLRFSNKSGSHQNCIRLNPANSWEHELQKVKVCWKLLKEKKEFLTETIFKNNKRADIINLTDNIIIEILHSESVEDFNNKNYPLEATYILSGEED